MTADGALRYWNPVSLSSAVPFSDFHDTQNHLTLAVGRLVFNG